ncbi:MAG: glycosyltransferase [Nanohaloarchaea archaeon]|nr:glycosyltransferase [Candidatus Nanohaloarchaea archaeon]
MKIFLIYDSKGNLGDNIRITRIIRFLQKNRHDVIHFNLNEHYKKNKMSVFKPRLIAETLKNLINISDKKVFVNKIYQSYGRTMLSNTIKNENPDIIICESPKLAAMCLKINIGCKIILDVHGVGFLEYKENKFIRKKSEKYIRYLDDIERTAFKDSDYLMVVSNNMKKYITENFKIDPKKIIVVSNGADIQEKTAKYSDDIKVVYGGIFAFWEDIDSYLDLAKENNNAKFFLMGGGPMEKHLLKRIEKEDIAIEFIGYLKKDKSLSKFAEMQIGIAPSTNNLTRYVACPIKVFDYMACGLPVITPDYGEWAKIVKKYDCGIVTKSSNGKEFNCAVKKLKNKDVWNKKSKNAIETIKKHYNWDALLKPLGKLLNELEKK